MKRIDYHAVDIDATAGTAFINRPNVRIHLGGIGMGFAIDRGAAMFKARGLADFMIQFGGDLYVAGSDRGRPWKLAIADPRGRHDPFATLQLTDAGRAVTDIHDVRAEHFELADYEPHPAITGIPVLT